MPADDQRRNTISRAYATGADRRNSPFDRASTFARRWQLTVEAPFEPLTWSLVMPVTQADGTGAVLKIGPPGVATEREAAALRLFAGAGAPALLAVDTELGALLLERVEPGTLLSSIADDAQATAVAADVMQRLWRPLPAQHSFPSVATLAADLDSLRPICAGGDGPIPARLFDMAQALFADLITSQGEPVLLHGDLHHANILRSTRRGWLAIDPKGLAGEREYEAGALLRNPASLLQQPHPQRILARRIAQLAEQLTLDRQRLHGWALAQAVLAACWGLEDTGHVWEQGLACAELLAEIDLTKAVL